MKCRNCGREIGDFSAFCTYCGASTGSEPAESARTSECVTSVPDEPLPGYSEPFEQTGREAPSPFYNVDRHDNPQINLIPEQNRTQTSFVPDYEDEYMNGTTWREINQMGHIIGEDGRFCLIKWLRFNKYFLLFALAAIDAIRAISFFTGFRYGYRAQWFYNVIPGVFTLDMIMGALQILFMGAMIFLWLSITELRRRVFLLSFSITLAGFLTEIIYISVWCRMTGSAFWSEFSFWNVLYIILLAGISVYNFFYFKRRRTVFIN